MTQTNQPVGGTNDTLDAGASGASSNPAPVTIKERETVYKLVISQMFFDGYQDMALDLCNRTGIRAGSCGPSDRLSRVVTNVLRSDPDSSIAKEMADKAVIDTFSAHLNQTIGCIDLDYESDKIAKEPEPAGYETVFVTSHKGSCRAGAFNQDGTLAATGSVDASIKILDVGRMIAKTHHASHFDDMSSGDTHPVIRTLYDHNEEVTCLAFHPTDQILASGSEDATIKLFDYTRPNVKRSMKSIQEVYDVRTIAFHPSGDFLLVGTSHPTLRLYDLSTSRCFVSSNPYDQHSDSVVHCIYSPNGALYATASDDGAIKLWDGVSNRCIQTFRDAHDRSEVSSIQFSKNGKYLLSSGKDSVIKLWELSMSRCLIAYTRATPPARPQGFHSQATFNHSEDFVLMPDESTVALHSWNSRNAERLRTISLGHQMPVRYFVHSPTTPSFLTCSDDHRMRFWHFRAATSSGAPQSSNSSVMDNTMADMLPGTSQQQQGVPVSATNIPDASIFNFASTPQAAPQQPAQVPPSQAPTTTAPGDNAMEQ